MRLNSTIFIPLLALAVASLACVQDCIMTGATVVGTVHDRAGNPIASAEIQIVNTPVDWSTPAQRVLQTDEEGNFEPERVSYFKCEVISFTVRADGYQNATATYILDQGLLNSLPTTLHFTLDPAA